MGPRIENCGSPNSADDMEDVPHRPNVYVTDVPRDDRATESRTATRESRPANRDPRIVNRDHRPATREHRPADDTETFERLRNRRSVRCNVAPERRNALPNLSPQPQRSVLGIKKNIPNTVSVLGILFHEKNIPNTVTVLGILSLIPISVNTVPVRRSRSKRHVHYARTRAFAS
jgi:hypothetical protein